MKFTDFKKMVFAIPGSINPLNCTFIMEAPVEVVYNLNHYNFGLCLNTYSEGDYEEAGYINFINMDEEEQNLRGLMHSIETIETKIKEHQMGGKFADPEQYVMDHDYSIDVYFTFKDENSMRKPSIALLFYIRESGGM